MKDIKLRIRSMESTKHITKAMEMVAASKLRRAEESAKRTRPYFQLMYDTAGDIAAQDSEFSSPYILPREVKRKLYVIIAGDRGLAGGYNHNVLKLFEEDRGDGPVTVLPIGKKALETMTAHNEDIWSDSYPLAAELSISDSFTMAKGICTAFLNGEFDEVSLVYTSFESMLTQTPKLIKLLPLDRDIGKSRKKDSASVTIYEPDGETVFNRIIPEYLGGVVFGALCESEASEQAARRNAMDSATKNAEEMIEDLSLKYNRARQGAITQEITEIVAGAGA